MNNPREIITKAFAAVSLKTILLHLVFWIAVWFFFVYFFSYNSDSKVYILWFSGALLPVTMLVTYTMVFFLIPRFLLKKKYWRFGLYSFYILVVSSYWIVLVIYGSLIVILESDVASMPPMTKNFSSVLLLVYLVTGLVSMVYLLHYNFLTISRNKELQNKILTAQLQLKEQELNYLKMQIHPHFLFNTLNTIYGFALKRSEHTPDIILKLSNLLDYILYQVNKPRVSLREEARHIREYIELERIRFRESLKVYFRSDELPEDLQVAPMLMIPLVENAFKHGNHLDGFLQVDIEIQLSGKRLNFRVKNTAAADKGGTEEGGIGLENVRKRLDLHYGNNYELRTQFSAPWFYASFSLYDVNATSYEG